MTDSYVNEDVQYWNCKYHPSKGLILECVHIYTEFVEFDGDFRKSETDKYIVESGSGLMYIADEVFEDVEEVLTEQNAEHILNSDGSIPLERLEFMSNDMVYFSINGGKAIANTKLYKGLVNGTALQKIKNADDEQKEFIRNKAGI